MYPVKRKWQPESYPSQVEREAPLYPIKKRADIQTIPGLTLYLQHTSTDPSRYGPLMVLFESFVRSNVNFSFDSNKCLETGLPCEHPEAPKCKCLWMTNLFIEGKLISSGYHKKVEKSKAEAAEKALKLLLMCQPTQINSAKESYYMKHEVLPGLVLHYDHPLQAGKRSRSQWYQVLMDSCQKCGLAVSWWQNFDAFFVKKWTAVLLIDSKPISFAWKESLGEAKREAAERVMPLLKWSHPVEYKDDNSISKLTLHLNFEGEENLTEPYRILQRNAARIGKLFHMRDRMVSNEETGDTVFFTDMYFYRHHISSGTGPSKKEARLNASKEGLQQLMKTLPVVIGNVDAPEKDASTSQHPKPPDESQSIPGLICYLRSPDQGKDSWHIIVHRAATRFGCSVKMQVEDGTFNDQHLLSLRIGEHLIAIGCGPTRKAAKREVLRKSVARLVRNQPVVYILADGKEISDCDYDVNKAVADGEGMNEEKFLPFITESEWYDCNSGLELISSIISDQDARTMIEKYITQYINI